MIYLSVGPTVGIPKKDVVGIFDLDTATLSSAVTRAFLKDAEKNGLTESDAQDIPKSFVVYKTAKKSASDSGFRICFSGLSSAVLRERAQDGNKTVTQDNDTETES